MHFESSIVSQRVAQSVHNTAKPPVVLLVDDDDAVRRITAMVIQRAGYQVLTAADAAVALDLAEKASGIRVVVTDVVMPQVNGMQLAEGLRNIARSAEILFYSGHSISSLRSDGYHIDPAHFIAKPFTPVELTRKLQALIALSN